MTILPVGAELYRVDGQTDMTKLTVAFLNFSKKSKNRIRQDTSKSIEIYYKVHGLPSKSGNCRLQKEVF
jgi:ribosomal protein L18E